MSNTYRSKQYCRSRKTKSVYKRLYFAQRLYAKRRSIEWGLDIKTWYRLVKSDCYLCGDKPKNRYKVNHRGREIHGMSFIYQGIDRINNSRGYLIDNVAPCCASCNYMKRSQTLSGLAKKIEKIQNKGVLQDLSSFIKSLKNRGKNENKES